jgi:hypothetical protein
MQVLQLFTELIALPPNAICIKCYDFEWPMNSSRSPSFLWLHIEYLIRSGQHRKQVVNISFIIAFAFVYAGTCLASRFLATIGWRHSKMV